MGVEMQVMPSALGDGLDEETKEIMDSRGTDRMNDVGVPETEDGSAPEGPSERSHGGTTEPPPRERSLGMFNQQVTAATTY